MSFDVWIVGFGLSRVLIDLKLRMALWRTVPWRCDRARCLAVVRLLHRRGATGSTLAAPEPHVHLRRNRQKLVDERVVQFRDQTRRFLAGSF